MISTNLLKSADYGKLDNNRGRQKKINQAINKKQRTLDDPQWMEETQEKLPRKIVKGKEISNSISESTWKRFRLGKNQISAVMYQACCEVLGLKKEEVGVVATKSNGSKLITEEDLTKEFDEANLIKKTLQDSTFSFGTMKTTWLIKDGTGEFVYKNNNIKTNFINEKLILPPDLKEKRNGLLEKNRIDKKFWNGERYFLDKFNIYRTPLTEIPCLYLTFGLSDYATFLVTNQQLNKDLELRRKYIDEKWHTPAKWFSNGFSIYLSVITSDGYIVVTQRAETVQSRPLEFNVSVNEALSKTNTVDSLCRNEPKVT
jgi:hypothetical protein